LVFIHRTSHDFEWSEKLAVWKPEFEELQNGGHDARAPGMRASRPPKMRLPVVDEAMSLHNL
jgi:hypothetical protein